MATNMNMSRKPNVGLNDFNSFPMAQGDYFPSKELSSANFGSSAPNNPLPQPTQGPLLGQTGPNPYQTNNYAQNMAGFARQYDNSVEMSRHSGYSALANMAAFGSRTFPPSHVPAVEQYRLPMKYTGSDAWNTVNKGLEQGNYTQQHPTSQNTTWPADFMNRSQIRMAGKMTAGKSNRDQILTDGPMNQPMNIDPSFGNHSGGGGSSGQQTAYNQLPPRPYLPSDMYNKPVREPHIRGMTPNFQAQDFYQQEQIRQMTNAQQYPQVPHSANKYMAQNQGGSPSPFSQAVINKGPLASDPMYSQYVAANTKVNGPNPIANMHTVNMGDRNQMAAFPSPSYPVSPAGSQISGKPGYGGQTMAMRGTVSPNVTIGLPKKQYQPPEESVTSPSSGGNQNAAAAAAAAAVLAAINSASSAHTSPQSSSGDVTVPLATHAPGSISSNKDGRSHSPATSLSDHKSESGGSGINDLGTTPSPAKSMTRSSPQIQPPSSSASFSSDIATGRVPSPTINQLPSTDIEAMIQSVSNIPGEALPLNDLSALNAQRNKRDSSKLSGLPKLETGTTLSPVTPPSPFSLSPSITDFELDILSPSWEDTNNGVAPPTQQPPPQQQPPPVTSHPVATTAPISKVYKLSDDPERKIFLDRLVMLAQQQGKSFSEIPIHNGAVLDLYKFYKLISERGGFHEVIRMKQWKDVIQHLTQRSDPSPVESQTLRDHYVRLMLPFEAKFANTLPSQVMSPFPPSAPARRAPTNHPAGNFQTPSQHGSIDLSSLNYKNLSMFQSPGGGGVAPFAGNPQPNRPAGYNAPNTQMSNYGGPTMPHQMSNYRNVQQIPPGFPGFPPQSPRMPGYPGASTQGYPNQQFAGYSAPPNAPHMSGYHPGYQGNSNVPPDSMYMRDGDFPRSSPHPMNKPYMQDPQHSPMFANYPQPPQQHASMFQQQQQQHFPMTKKPQFGTRASQQAGTPSPDQRVQAMQNQWGRKYPQNSAMPDHNLPPYQLSQSPKVAPSRPPPPYPKLEKGQLPSSGAPQQHMRVPPRGSPRKEEPLFPVGCVEATKPMFPKKRRLTARDIGPVEAWRIMMSLKSGLLNESAWALDTLTILLCDDSTVGFFRLAHLPGLLDTIVEHFRRSLINVFGILEENEVEVGVPGKYIYRDGEEDSNNDVKLRSEESYTAVIVSDCIEESEDMKEASSFSSGAKTWSHGGGDTTVHIQTHFETDPQFYQQQRPHEEDMCQGMDTDQDGPSMLGKVNEDSERQPFVDDTVNKSKEKVYETMKRSDTCTNDDESPKITSGDSLLHNGVMSPGENGAGVDESPDAKSKKNCGNEHAKKTIKQEIDKEDDSSVSDPAALLVKRLKTELDLDVECLNEESESVEPRAHHLPVGMTSEEECEMRQEFPLSTVTWSQNAAIKCCMCVSNIIRSLSFVPRNDVEMAKHPSLLLILGKLFLLHHLQKRKGLPRDHSQHSDKNCWWADCLEVVRENALVTVANIAGYLDLSLLADTVSVPLLDGLLHWLVCQSTTAVDCFKNIPSTMPLSPKNLALETLAKMSVLESNVNFILMSPNKETLSKVHEFLVKLFSDKSNEVTREFALVLLSSLTQSNNSISSSLSSDINLITVLVGFLEDATESMQALAARGLHPGLFPDDDMHVSVGMLRRAAALLACIAKRNNSAHLIPFQERILTLSMTPVLDVEVQAHLSNVLYNLPR